MTYTTIYIALCVSFILWLLLLLLIISKLSALNSRISRLVALLGEFDKIEAGNKPASENNPEKKPEKA
jgi:hypothetical protein